MRLVAAALACLIALPAWAAEEPVKAEKRKKIDLVIALDTSNSMDGLIGSAKARLWDVVNELARAKPTPELRVALLTYGNDSYPATGGYVRVDSAFTKDLDELYTKLNGVTTNGGSEYVARVTKVAMDDLKWDDSQSTLKILFVAGNEAADQDPQFKVNEIAKAAISKGIVVNTIFCGSAGDSVAAGWSAVAKMSDGKFAVIDQDAGVKVASAPQDQKLAELSRKLNDTYIAYGSAGRKKAEAQKASDEAASAMGAGVAASRAQAKSGKLYDASEWDIVDAKEKKDFDVKNAPAEALPEPMQKMSGEEREEFVAKKAKDRAKIQAEIDKLSKERQTYLEKEQAKAGKSDGLDAALKDAIRTQAEKKGFTFEK